MKRPCSQAAQNYNISVNMLNYWMDFVQKTGESTIPLNNRTITTEQLDLAICDHIDHPYMSIFEIANKYKLHNTSINNRIKKINKYLLYYEKFPNTPLETISEWSKASVSTLNYLIDKLRRTKQRLIPLKKYTKKSNVII